MSSTDPPQSASTVPTGQLAVSVLLLLPVAVALVAMITARMTVLRTLGRMP